MQPIPSFNDGNANPYREPPPPLPLPPVSVLESFKFAFDPEGGVGTILMATLCLFIPIVGPIALKGYEADILQRLVRRDGVTLPKFEFNAFGSYLTRGLATFVVEMLIWVPVWIVGVGAMVLFMIAWTTTLPAHGSHDHGPSAGALGFLFAAPVLVSLVLLTGSVVFNAVTTRAALTEDIVASFNLKEVSAYARRMFGPTLLAMLVFGVVASAAVLIGMIGFVICMYPMVVIAQLAFTHLRFQLYERYVATGGTPIPLKPQMLPAHPYGSQAYNPQGYGGYQPAPNAQGYTPPRYPGQ